MTFGSRFIGTPRRALYFWHTVMNRGLTLVSNMLNDLNLTDMETCYKAFRAEVIKAIDDRGGSLRHRARAHGEGGQAAPAHLRGPVSYHGRTYAEGKKIGWKDGVRAMYCIVKYGIRRSRYLCRKVKAQMNGSGSLNWRRPARSDCRAGGGGGCTLEILTQTPGINRWMYDQIAGVTGDVLEIGSGLGNVSRLIVADANRAVLTEVEPMYLEALRRQFAGNSNVEVLGWDLDQPPPVGLAHQRFDTAIAINVIEHIRDDRAAVKALASLLKPNGSLFVYVPACPFAYGTLDQALGHYRRHTRASLADLVSSAGLIPDEPRYMNRLGLVGWLVSGRVLRRRVLSTSLVALFDRIVPLAQLLDRATAFMPFGLGVVVRARKP